LTPSNFTLVDPEGSKVKVIVFDVKYVKNGKNYDVGPTGFTSDDLERLKVKVTNGPMTAIGMWGYRPTPVRITGVSLGLLMFCFSKLNLHVILNRYFVLLLR